MFELYIHASNYITKAVSSSSAGFRNASLYTSYITSNIFFQASYNFSIQPHGVFYNKSNEGSLYNDGTSGIAKQDDLVKPGQTFGYDWTIPEHVGPTKDDPDCLTWVYSSAVDPIKDVYSGNHYEFFYQQNKISVPYHCFDKRPFKITKSL